MWQEWRSVFGATDPGLAALSGLDVDVTAIFPCFSSSCFDVLDVYREESRRKREDCGDTYREGELLYGAKKEGLRGFILCSCAIAGK